MIPEWEQPVAAVLDHYGLDDVAAGGISLGGGLVIRAAAFEPRISRVVAFDILDDFLETIARQIGRGVRIPLRALLTARARRVINAPSPTGPLLASRFRGVGTAAGDACHRHCHTPYDFLRSTIPMNTGKISNLVRADVLLLGGADDHYVPLKQLGRQGGTLSNARSVTTRIFTAAEQASNHCQVVAHGVGVVGRLGHGVDGSDCRVSPRRRDRGACAGADALLRICRSGAGCAIRPRMRRPRRCRRLRCLRRWARRQASTRVPLMTSGRRGLAR